MKVKLRLFQFYLLGMMLLQALSSEAQSVIKIASNDNGILFVKSDGSLWWINNVDKMENKPPSEIVSSNVTAVAACGFNCFWIKSDGSLWSTSADSRQRQGQIVPSGVTAVAAGDGFTIFLKDDGSLWEFSSDNYGQLGAVPGLNEFDNDVPKKIVPNGVIAIAAGEYYILFIRSDGSLWGMGNNIYGQLGEGTYENIIQPKQIVNANVTAVAAGNDHSLFIKSDGSLWAMGNKEFGKLGDGDIEDYDKRGYSTNYAALVPEQIVASNVTAVAAGDTGSIFLKNDGSLWAMGWSQPSYYGEGIEFNSVWPVQIAAGNSARSAPLVAGYYYDAALKSTASLWAKSFNNQNQPSGGTAGSIVKSGLTVVNPLGYNLISIQLLSDGNVRISYLGVAGTNYALDRSYTLTSPDWLPQVTNTAGVGGVLVITNTPNPGANNFWRIRSVQ